MGKSLAGLIVAVLLIAISIARVAFWSRRFGRRSLLATETHLVLCTAGDVEQWVSWNDVERLLVVPSDPVPEWSRSRTNWFHVVPQPELAVMPPEAFVGGFHDMLISSRASRAAARRVQAAARARGVPCDEI